MCTYCYSDLGSETFTKMFAYRCSSGLSPLYIGMFDYTLSIGQDHVMPSFSRADCVLFSYDFTGYFGFVIHKTSFYVDAPYWRVTKALSGVLSCRL